MGQAAAKGRRGAPFSPLNSPKYQKKLTFRDPPAGSGPLLNDFSFTFVAAPVAPLERTLPMEVVRLILSHLTEITDLYSVLSVCKLWQAQVKEGTVFLDAFDWRERLGDSQLLALLKRTPTIRSIRLSGCQLLSDASISAMATACPYLEQIILNRCLQFTTASLDALSQLPYLEVLSLGSCSQLADGDLAAALREGSFPALKTMILASTKAGPATAQALLRQWALGTRPCLLLLDLSSCAGMTGTRLLLRPEGERSSAPPSIDSALHPLEIRLSCTGVRAGALADLALSPAIGHLRHLVLALCPSVDDEALAALARGFRLATLDLSHCTTIGDRGLRDLSGPGSTLASTLIELNLASCPNLTEAGVAALCVGCPGLEALSLASNSGIGDAVLAAVAAGLPRIRTLDLSRTSVALTADEPDSATPSALFQLASERLYALNLSHCPVPDGSLLVRQLLPPGMVLQMHETEVTRPAWSLSLGRLDVRGVPLGAAAGELFRLMALHGPRLATILTDAMCHCGGENALFV
ncbi:putative leucine Rich Repeat family protein [Paratrimastix pyriformis]|uniref:Leucine Rich Repeat family protein n=1 Tax=Paratrimastix pyriformis TaxID=342808 RepID=A0ABQ8UVQ5_9EUKA|nr:putative leucine Rich Repeat family protein [Paratrimastix pyriformis]